LYRYYSKDKSGTYAEKASSNLIGVEDTYPLQGHLSLREDPTEMTLMWVSNSNLVPKVMYLLVIMH
jgi:hypothetical protein